MKETLVLCTNLSNPYVYMSGNKAILETLKLLSKECSLKITVVSSYSSDSKPLNIPGITFKYIRSSNLAEIKLKSYYYLLTANKRFDYIIEFGATPVLSLVTSLLSYFIGSRYLYIHTTCSVHPLTNLFQLNTKELPLYINLDAFLKINKPGDKGTYLYIGPLEDRKGVFLLANATKHALKKKPYLKFIIATFGKELRDPSFQRNLLRFRNALKGYENNLDIRIGHHNVIHLMESVENIIIPTTNKKGTLKQPLTLLEALASNRNVILSDIYPGFDEVANYFKNNDSDSLVDTLLNPKVLPGRKYIKKNYSRSKILSTWYNLFKI